MSVSFFVVDRCGDVLLIDSVMLRTGMDVSVISTVNWMEIGYKINECFKLFSWKGSDTNNTINVSFDEVRNGTFVFL